MYKLALMFFILALAILLGLVPAAIAQSKGRSFLLWWIYGAAIWIVAFPHSLIMKADQDSLEARGLQSGQKKCPHCAELVREEAVVCRHCGRNLDEQEQEVVGSLQRAAKFHEEVTSTTLAEPPRPLAPKDNPDVILAVALGVVLLVAMVFAIILFMPKSSDQRVAEVFSRRTVAVEYVTPVPTDPSTCSVVDRHGFIAFVVCPPNASSTDWTTAGIKACGALSICKAWIWDREGNAATSLPMTDAQVNAAVAVWSNGPQELTTRSGSALPLSTSERVGARATTVLKCSIIDRQAFVVFVVCDPGMSEVRWRLESRKACGARRVCNVWIWDNRQNAASSLPMSDVQVNSAVAVWVNATQELSNCERYRC